jgi:predicted transporter
MGFSGEPGSRVEAESMNHADIGDFLHERWISDGMSREFFVRVQSPAPACMGAVDVAIWPL